MAKKKANTAGFEGQKPAPATIAKGIF